MSLVKRWGVGVWGVWWTRVGVGEGWDSRACWICARRFSLSDIPTTLSRARAGVRAGVGGGAACWLKMGSSAQSGIAMGEQSGDNAGYVLTEKVATIVSTDGTAPILAEAMLGEGVNERGRVCHRSGLFWE